MSHINRKSKLRKEAEYEPHPGYYAECAKIRRADWEKRYGKEIAGKNSFLCGVDIANNISDTIFKISPLRELAGRKDA